MDTSTRLALHFWQRKILPIILQTETAECGLACVAMVSSYWGHQIDLASVRRKFSISLKGTSLKSLMGLAKALSFHPRPLKAELNEIYQLKLPCILHLDLNHFVVLKRVLRDGVVIHDPAVGECRIKKAELSRRFTGVALELVPDANFQRACEKVNFSMRSLMGRVVGLRSGLVQIFALGIAIEVFSLVAPFYIQWIVDDALIANDRDLITVLGLGFLLLVVLQTVISAVRSWFTVSLATSLNFQWLGNAFSHLMKLPLPYFEKRHLGDIVSRFGSIQTIQKSLTSQYVDGIIDGILALGTAAVMFVYNAQLTEIAIVTILIYTILRACIFRPLRNETSQQIIHSARQQTHFLESARGIQSIKLFGKGAERRLSWLNAVADQFNSEMKVSRLSIFYKSSNTFLFSAERVLMIWLAAFAVLENKLSIGMLFAFISYKDQFSQRTVGLIDKLFDLWILRLHGERVADIVLATAEEQTPYFEIGNKILTYDIEIRNVYFRYSDSEPYILRDLNLSIPDKQAIAITGPSGSGKTTLVKLLMGLIEPTEGEIFIGGVKLGVLSSGYFRSNVGTVMQEDQLFSGSLADNIAFFDSHPSQQQIEICAEMAAIRSEIEAMPMGYETLVGNIGTGLSGGQKQRILLARALYRKPRLLVLDEATSHLDIVNESLVNAAIKGIDLTRIIVAHRAETIGMAERVVVLGQGKVALDSASSLGSAVYSS